MKKMVMAIIPRDHANRVLMSLVEAGFAATYGDSRGGRLRQSQQSVFVAVEHEDVEVVLSVIKNNCRKAATAESSGDDETSHIPASAELGGAVVFVWDIERIENF
jgi:uncharacterized protein YaaQ